MDRRPSHPVINYALLALGSAIAAFAVEEFLVPNTILDGGVIGVGMMISHVTGIPLALLTVILNAPLLELGSPSRSAASGSEAGAFIIPDFPTIPELEERYLRYVLERTGGKVCGPDGAESLLHLKRSTIYLKLKKYGIIPSDFI